MRCPKCGGIMQSYVGAASVSPTESDDFAFSINRGFSCLLCGKWITIEIESQQSRPEELPKIPAATRTEEIMLEWWDKGLGEKVMRGDSVRAITWLLTKVVGDWVFKEKAVKAAIMRITNNEYKEGKRAAKRI